MDRFLKSTHNYLSTLQIPIENFSNDFFSRLLQVRKIWILRIISFSLETYIIIYWSIDIIFE